MPRHVPWRLWQWAADRLASDWYDIWALTLEAQAARELIARRGTVHILNGEDTYRLLGFVPRASRGRLVCTYHLTPRGLRELLPSARRLRRIDARKKPCGRPGWSAATAHTASSATRSISTLQATATRSDLA